MSKSNVLSFADKRRELDAKGSFLEMLDSDMQNDPDCIVPIPRSIFDEIAHIRARAEENKRRELLEG
ncbi:hypothetical protein ACGFZ7_16250 [Pseudomonas sp. NPDC047963]|nr:hypothetical protein [Pseudomonas sp.]|tara:strand:+ start:252 stop:452 length:201 start_codon:yes stop_codon:yes gene_type:complete